MIPVSEQHRSPIVQKVTTATGKIKVFRSNVTHASQTDIFFLLLLLLLSTYLFKTQSRTESTPQSQERSTS